MLKTQVQTLHYDRTNAMHFMNAFSKTMCVPGEHFTID